MISLLAWEYRSSDHQSPEVNQRKRCFPLQTKPSGLSLQGKSPFAILGFGSLLVVGGRGPMLLVTMLA